MRKVYVSEEKLPQFFVDLHNSYKKKVNEFGFEQRTTKPVRVYVTSSGDYAVMMSQRTYQRLVDSLGYRHLRARYESKTALTPVPE